MRKLVFLMICVSLIFCAHVKESHADTYHQLKQCLKNCIDTTPALSWDRFVCVADCYAAWADQKISININIGATSSGYGVSHTHPIRPYLMIYGLSSVKVDFNVLSSDPLQRIDLYLVNDTYNPPDPNFGLLVGSDTNGADGWSITFDPDLGGTDLWVGNLVAEAHFTGHDLETDGDIASIYITRNPHTVGYNTTWLVIAAIFLMLAGGYLVFRRKRWIRT
ncbi:MAG: LPXTG cell wall anchor domain-containing protein [Nitrospirota bacterium]